MMPGSKLDAQSALRHLQSLMDYLALKASEEMDEGGEESEESEEEESGEYSAGGESEKQPGLGIVIAMKPKGGPGGKVPGCPDCMDGTPHEHMK